jgi:hypothetical protein
MKLRLHANSLRLRLSQSEVARLAETGRLDDSVTFAPGQILSYSVESGAADAVAASFDNNRIRVVLPEAQAKHWIESEQEGIGSDAGLRIQVEKDFECLHKPAEEDADTFPNPMADKF